jgi:hypothetical protein
MNDASKESDSAQPAEAVLQQQVLSLSLAAYCTYEYMLLSCVCLLARSPQNTSTDLPK